MPCGGIYPISGSWVEPIEAQSVAPLRCFHCDKSNPKPELWCEEWDSGLHRECVPAFLMTHDGKLIMEHGHLIHIPEKGT